MTRVATKGIILALIVFAAPLPRAAAGDAQAGKALAQSWCKSCHVVGPRGSGTDAVPSFAAIASDPTLTAERLRTFLANPRHPMPNPQLANTEIEDLVAYIQSLKR
jgi:mono/diheme cytochrome c family protein